eukprot:TRINITY_DN13072_c0_g1_i11.p1 TRINITY_DN13072_c0_g1~~TRINITY_DN13072_c0_g1_i11.p1  ORF type:complete len:312 (-),score=97.35 TRINITY_DN13072_c0_g1_i11:653-1588(-)
MEPLTGEKLIYYSIGFVNDPRLMDEFEQYEPDLTQFNSTVRACRRRSQDAEGEDCRERDQVHRNGPRRRAKVPFLQRPLKEEGGGGVHKEHMRHNPQHSLGREAGEVLYSPSRRDDRRYFRLTVDDKDRLSLLTGLQKGKDKEDIVDLFMRYFVGASNADQGTKDVVANILAKLLTSKDLKGMEDKMKEFLNYLLSMQASDNSAERPITSLGFSVALMHLLKVGEIALYFIKSEGLTTLNELLLKEKEDKQICYNLLVSFWITTFKPHAQRFFETRQNEFIENMIKVLQLHGNEKIVRVILYIFKVRGADF